jgi:hypothetical protein
MRVGIGLPASLQRRIASIKPAGETRRLPANRGYFFTFLQQEVPLQHEPPSQQLLPAANVVIANVSIKTAPITAEVIFVITNSPKSNSPALRKKGLRWQHSIQSLARCSKD